MMKLWRSKWDILIPICLFLEVDVSLFSIFYGHVYLCLTILNYVSLQFFILKWPVAKVG